ncbi:DUF6153 family protein [Streptomyces sp. NPDC005070]
MRVSGRVRTAGAFGHLLLVVVLALGVFLMHSLGHPQESGSTGVSTASHGTASHSSVDSTAEGPTHGPGAATPAGMTGKTKSPGHVASPHEPPMAMDMSSLCVAVLLGAGALFALVRSLFPRHADQLAALLARSHVVPRPRPPPRGPDLTRLSVLRL